MLAHVTLGDDRRRDVRAASHHPVGGGERPLHLRLEGFLLLDGGVIGGGDDALVALAASEAAGSAVSPAAAPRFEGEGETAIRQGQRGIASRYSRDGVGGLT
jgi:hypothetical protein